MAAETVGISEVIDRQPLGGFQKMVVVICAAIAFMEGFGAQNAGAVAPGIAKAFHLSKADLGNYFSLGLFGLMLGALFMAPLADRLGRKPVLLFCVTMFGLCSLGQAISTSEPILYTFRFLNLLGIGGAMPNAIAMTSEYSPHRSRSLMIVFMFNGFIGGSIVVGLLASKMVESLGWGSVLAVGGVLPLLLVPIIALWLPESPRFLASKGNQNDKIAAVMRRIDPTLNQDTRFVLDDHSTARMSVAALFQNGRAIRTVLLWVLVFCSLLDLFLFTNWLPTQIHSLGVSVGIAILIGALLQVGGMVGMVLGWMMDRVGPAKTLFISYLIAAGGIVALALVGNSVPLLALSVLATGFGVVGGQTAANAVAAASYPTEIRATGVGWFLGIGRAGSILGPMLAGYLLQSGWSNQAVFMLAVVPALVAAGAGLGLGAGAARGTVAAKEATA